MTTEDKKDTPCQDWSQLAKEALDVWQNHLTALASDEKAKEEMAQFVAPMTQMYAQWTNMMQTGFQDLMATVVPTPPAAKTESSPDFSPEARPEKATPHHDDISPLDAHAAAPSAASAGNAEPLAEPVAKSAAEPAAEPVTELVLEPERVEPERAEAAPAVAAAPSPAPVSAPVVESESKPAPAAVPSSGAGGRAAASDGTRDLAELAGRLASLERELDSLRPRAKRAGGDGGSSAALSENDSRSDRGSEDDDARDAQADERVAGAHKG